MNRRDYCSKGVDGTYHRYNDCGMHYEKFDDLEGQKYYRSNINPILKDYGQKFEISEKGEILELAPPGLASLFNADIPSEDSENVTIKVKNAMDKFRRYRSTINERKEAVRELADVLEFLRPEAKKHLEKGDEKDLFNIANNFGIRHHNDKQKNNYDKAIWLSWMFYFYLSTIHALLRLIEKNETQ